MTSKSNAIDRAPKSRASKERGIVPPSLRRTDSAVKIVLAGDVELQADGTAKVASQSNGQTAYFVVNGECSCKDYPKAPQGFCKHRLAYGIHKRAYALAKAKLEQLNGTSQSTSQPPAEQPQGEPQAQPKAQPQGGPVPALPILTTEGWEHGHAHHTLRQNEILGSPRH